MDTNVHIVTFALRSICLQLISERTLHLNSFFVITMQRSTFCFERVNSLHINRTVSSQKSSLYITSVFMTLHFTYFFTIGNKAEPFHSRAIIQISFLSPHFHSPILTNKIFVPVLSIKYKFCTK